MSTATQIVPSGPIAIGTPAPDFTLKDQDGKEFALATYKGKRNVVLFFYPLDWSPTCTTENQCFTRDLPQFSAYAEVVAISIDSVYSHKAWAEKLGLQHRLLSDIKREVCKAYGLYLESANISQRATVVIDKTGVVTFVKVQQDIAKARDYNEVLEFLKKA